MGVYKAVSAIDDSIGYGTCVLVPVELMALVSMMSRVDAHSIPHVWH